MDCDDALRHCGHSDDIPSNAAEKTILCACLKIGSGNSNKNSLLNFDFQLKRNFFGQRDQLFCVRLGHIRKPGAKFFIVRADQRVVAEQVDVVGDEHDVTTGEKRVHSAGSVGDEQRVDSQKLHHADRKRDLLHRIAFIIMKAPLHRDNAFSTERPKDQFAVVGFDRRQRKMWNVGIIDYNVGFNFFCQSSEPGAENNSYGWRRRGLCA